jgi:hypothetical protein
MRVLIAIAKVHNPCRIRRKSVKKQVVRSKVFKSAIIDSIIRKNKHK